MQHLAALAAGISTHALYLRRGEHHLHGFFYFKLFLTSLLAVAALLHNLHPLESSWKSSSTHSLTLHLAYLLGILLSLLTYRALLHPLSPFPGPLDLKLSALSLTFRVRHQDAHKVLLNLHATHGAFVRIGPAAISSIHPATPSVIHNAAHGFSKGEFYDLMAPFKPLQMLRDKAEHTARRRVWSAAFGERALRGYEVRTRQYQDRMMGVIASADGKVVDATRVFHAYSFDVIGDLALGMKFGLLESESKGHWAVDLLGEAVEVVAYMPPVWLFRFFFDIPGLNGRWYKWLNFCRETLVERIEVGLVPCRECWTGTDLGVAEPTGYCGYHVGFSCAAGRSEAKRGRYDGFGQRCALGYWCREVSRSSNSAIINPDEILTGACTCVSETTFAALAMMTYLLARHPDHQQRLREEVLPFMVTSGSTVTFSSESLAPLDHLNGIINETLRFYPALPTAAARKAPPQGATIGGTYIPGGTEVWCPLYTLGRSKCCVSRCAEIHLTRCR